MQGKTYIGILSSFTMKKIIISILSCLLAAGSSTAQIKLAARGANTIKLYTYDYPNTCDPSKIVSVVRENKISPCFRYIKTFEKNEAKTITKMLRSSATYSRDTTACFDTQYALLILNKAGVIIGYVDISLSCNKLHAVPAGWSQGRSGLSKEGKDSLLYKLELVYREGLIAP